MRELTRQERFAMYFWHEEYAAQGGGAIEFYKGLSPSSKKLVEDCLDRLDEAVRASRPAPREKL